ncbi:MAG: squalene/phytoene synthase family protein [Pseudomonadota bacterium]
MDDIDALARRVDEDRWLAARFASARTRVHLNALYALNYEIARTAETVTQGALGDIRLAWWREAIAEIYAGQTVRAHPVTQAFARVVAMANPPRAPLDALIDARSADLEPAPFATWDALEAYVDATAGGVIRVALALCGGEDEVLAADAGKAWGYAGLLRAAPFWAARGRTMKPGDAAEGTLETELRQRADGALDQASARAKAAAHTLFPAYGYVALARGYLRNPQRSLISRQLTLIGASASGRL